MRKITLLIILLLVCRVGLGQTSLSAGDIAITGFNSDDPDQISFVLLTDVLNTTTIHFTDNGWLNSGGFRTATSEGVISWSATSDLVCGTEIIIIDTNSISPNTYSATSGTVTETSLGFALNTISGDQILAYQGTDISPTFIYAVNFDGAGWTDATSTNDSALPTGLTDGINAINLGQIDNAVYDCSTTSDTSLVLGAVSTFGNWILDDSPLTTGGCYYSCASCSGGTVTWDGTIWSGTPDVTTQVIITSNYNTTNGGNEVSFSACALKVENGATLNIADNDYVEVQNDLTVDSGGVITVQPYGAFIQNDDSSNVTNNGSISVIKETAPLNAWYEYTYWSSPVSGETISQGLFESETSRRFKFNAQNFLDSTAETENDNTTIAGQDDIDDDGNDWQWVTGSTVMQAGIGYAATHSKTFFTGPPMSTPPYNFEYIFDGAFNNGVITTPIYRNDYESNDSNWNLIGNPYPSAIDANLFLAANSSVAQDITGTSYSGTGYTDGAIYLWSQNTAPSATANGNEKFNFSASDYAIINGTGSNAGGDGLTPNRFIPSGQGFFIAMLNTATPVSTSVNGDGHTISQGTVVFNNAMRVKGTTDNSQFFKNSNTKSKTSTSAINKLWINLTSNNGVFNQTLIGYLKGATNSDDGSYFDAIKNTASGTSAILYSTIEGSDKIFAIQGKAENSLTKDEVISLGFDTSIDVPTIYKLSVSKLEGNFLHCNTIYLNDTLTGTTHNLSTSDYNFTSEVGTFNNRFKISFTAKALAIEDNLLGTKSLKIIQLDNDTIQFSTSNNLSIKSVRVFDLLGRELYNLKGNSRTEIYKFYNLNNAVYIAKVELSNGIIITKKSIKN
ncbi:hypothetical protein [Thalassobellus suaedae]|uniref:T9SS type A sorting domain-containing protein n=1 Tax=Thalassobellus suaedae TaxID=3074124 RepID=A0ABY9Y6Y0_9FLAO|nr:hypothetical protein RHP49_06080 [Flavobacteriaceae bacterium HL-DH10]